ncbi:ATP-binding protein [Nonomuraea sp. NPDC048826]|uniref:ATP-binding protein n=1 Tax=Nonomuraea sp. NPDC048826 TaxID=3364347 RepID=UPI00371998A7
MSVSLPKAPPIPAELEVLFTRMRFPYARKAAPEVLATARAQRWDPAEVVRVLLAEEVVGRDNATRRSRRKSAGMPTGKSHFMEALCHQAIDADLRVSWFTLETLAVTIGRAHVDGSIARTIAKICRSDIIVIDDIGLLPVGHETAEAFYRLVDAAYERRSLAVTSNIHPSGFDTIMPKTMATATVDRLMHHAHMVETSGESHRLAEALAGKGVVPLT